LHAAEKASSKEDSDLALRFGELKWLWEQMQHQQEVTGLCFHSANWHHLEETPGSCKCHQFTVQAATQWPPAGAVFVPRDVSVL
jgi:hypothetical protein